MRRFIKYEQLFFVPKKVFKNLVKKKKKSTAPMKIYGHYFIPEVFLGKEEKDEDFGSFRRW